MGNYHVKLGADADIDADPDAKKLCTIVFPLKFEKIQIQTLTHGYQDCPRCFSKFHV
jgi:hypothetical protein